MPIPKPNKNETKNKFIERCMGDDKMNTEYPDNKQRLAVCNVSWKDKDKKSRGNMAVDKDKLKTDGIERRFTPQAEAEIRVAKDDNDLPVIEGYFAKFGKMSGDLGGFREVIERGFFKDALQGSDVIDLFNHDQNYPLARESAPGPEGSLKVWEDEVGLAYKVTPLNTDLIRDMVIIPIQKGVIKGNSFGFRTNKDGDRWENDKDGMPIRTLKAGGCSSIFDGSQVLFPAYPDTSLALRSLSIWTNRDESTVKVPDDIGDGGVMSDNEVIMNDKDGTEVTNPEDKKEEVIEDTQKQKINLDVPVNLKLNVTVEQESKEVELKDETKVEPLEDDSKDESKPSDENVGGDDSSNDEVNDNKQASDENVNEDENNSDDEQKPSEAEILAKQRDREIQLKKKHISLQEL